MSARQAAATPPASDPALPRSFDAGYGEGVRRGVSLGGGGLFFVAWQVAYLQTLADHGIRFDGADRLVGTSAGSVVASALAHGKLSRLHTETALLSKAPAMLSVLAPATDLDPSQQRALDLFAAATDASPSTIRSIGHAALAAITTRPETMRRNLALVLGRGAWTSDALRVTCVDTYTGERCVVTRRTGAPIVDAAAASSAIPGVFPPQPIAGRRCMDGGVSGSGIHLDLLAGAELAVVLALHDGEWMTEGMGTSAPGDAARELGALEGSGTGVVLRTPERVDVEQLMDPAAVPGALAMGARQAAADVGELTTFWS